MKELVFIENNGYAVSPIVISSVNVHDTCLLGECVEGLMDFANLIGMDLRESFVTLDSGFDSEANDNRLRFHELIPIIKPNLRGTKNQDTINERLDAFDEKTYKERYRVERTFAWEDSYRKLALRYEILPETHLGFKYLAFSLMNLKVYV